MVSTIQWGGMIQKSQARSKPCSTCTASWITWSPNALSWDTAATQEFTFSFSGQQCQLSPACQLQSPKQASWEIVPLLPLASWISELNSCPCRQEGPLLCYHATFHRLLKQLCQSQRLLSLWKQIDPQAPAFPWKGVCSEVLKLFS